MEEKEGGIGGSANVRITSGTKNDTEHHRVALEDDRHKSSATKNTHNFIHAHTP